MAAAIFDTTRNLSLYSIPAAWVLSIIPHFYAASLGAFDNKSPRSYTKDAAGDQKLDKSTKDAIIRAEGAQQNGFENIGLFAAAVVIGNVAKLDNSTLNTLSGAYLASRVVYNLLYINGTTDFLGKLNKFEQCADLGLIEAANLRSGTFLTGIGIIWTLFIKSGNVLRNQL
ncbi:MAG: hypothetical protein GOMPHAMPRED_006954 [Gomphillus americanus]|uniref:Uncharacterized protein n=1 Tax=Gomphillus americanus TaxID=1940652 RepID=A0A8H3EP58_9LECA|nr:MAG: hypothetical protein GOMPHAMPRED_006954 [Gomphillus americanus]